LPKTISSGGADTALSDLGVLILAGGQATRLPNKLELDAGRLPMIARVYRNVSANRETFISCKGTFPAAIDALLPCPMVVDRWPLRGPLSGILSTMHEMRSRYVFAVAGDAPFITSAFIDRLAELVRPSDEAVVPRHGGQIEPLAAIYDRQAYLRAGVPLLVAGKGALRLVIDGLRANYVEMKEDERLFANVNTPADYAAVHEVLK
jgi:molybdopterin-guanine dinucleotide biosynthesis protein A